MSFSFASIIIYQYYSTSVVNFPSCTYTSIITRGLLIYTAPYATLRVKNEESIIHKVVNYEIERPTYLPEKWLSPRMKRIHIL